LNLTAQQIAAEFGMSSRHWVRMANAGSIPGSWQPAGKGGQWLFNKQRFEAWQSQRMDEKWRKSINEAQSIGDASNIKVNKSGEASAVLIGKLLQDACIN